VPRSQIRFDEGAISTMLRGPNGIVGRDLRRRGRNVREDAQRRVRVRTGRLRAGIYVEMGHKGVRLVCHVGSRESYAMYEHEGHGWIFPERKKVLVFEYHGRTVFARKVRPVKGTFYLKRALRSAVR
jgi:hypothetical protein